MKFAGPAPVALALALIAGCGVQEIDREPVATPVPPPTGSMGGTGGSPVVPDAAAPPQTPSDAGPPPPEGAPPPTMPLPPPPGDGVGVTVGGQFVPRSKAIVVLHIGHSNMAGRATGPVELKPFFYD